MDAENYSPLKSRISILKSSFFSQRLNKSNNRTDDYFDDYPHNEILKRKLRLIPEVHDHTHAHTHTHNYTTRKL